MTRPSPSKSEPTRRPSGGRYQAHAGGGGRHGGRRRGRLTGDLPSPSRHHDSSSSRRRATDEATRGPSALHAHIAASRIPNERCRTRGNSVSFRPDPSSDECCGFEDGAGAEGEMDTSSLKTTHLSRDLSYGCDMDVASSLFQVMNKRSDAAAEADEDLEEQVQHWRAAASVALSLDPSARTADTLPRDNRSSRRPRRGRGGGREGDASPPSSSPGGFLPGPVSRPETPGRGQDAGLCISDDSGNDTRARAKAAVVARSEAAGHRRHTVAGAPPSSPPRRVPPSHEDSPEDDEEERSGVFSVDTATSSVLWDRIERSHSRGSLSLSGGSLSEGTRRRRRERIERSLRRVLRRGVKVAVAALALAALLLYLAFEADLESVDLGAWFGGGRGREEVAAAADARSSRKLFSFAEFLQEAKADPFPQAQGNPQGMRGAVAFAPEPGGTIGGNPPPRERRP